MKISVFVVDDQALVREGIVQLIGCEDDRKVAGEGRGGWKR